MFTPDAVGFKLQLWAVNDAKSMQLNTQTHNVLAVM